MIMLAFAFIISLGILFYYVTHTNDITSNVRSSVQEELKKYNLPSDKVSVDDSKVILSIARYCEANNGCRGPQGIAGFTIQGPQGIQGIQGQPGIPGPQGIQGAQGIVGADGKDGIDGKDGKDGQSIVGPQGEKGEPGPKTERRCNAEERHMEWRNVGDETWQVEYNLSPLQTCPTGS